MAVALVTTDCPRPSIELKAPPPIWHLSPSRFAAIGFAAEMLREGMDRSVRAETLAWMFDAIDKLREQLSLIETDPASWGHAAWHRANQVNTMLDNAFATARMMTDHDLKTYCRAGMMRLYSILSESEK